MAYKLIKTDSFQRDLDAVIAYIALSLENKVAAASLLDAIEKSYDGIERMPLMYESCRDPHLKELGYRRAVIQNYIMVYKVDNKTETVYNYAVVPRQAGLREADLTEYGRERQSFGAAFLFYGTAAEKAKIDGKNCM